MILLNYIIFYYIIILIYYSTLPFPKSNHKFLHLLFNQQSNFYNFEKNDNRTTGDITTKIKKKLKQVTPTVSKNTLYYFFIHFRIEEYNLHIQFELAFM